MNLREKERRGEGLKRGSEEGGEKVREKRVGRTEEAMGTTLTIGVRKLVFVLLVLCVVWMDEAEEKRKRREVKRRLIGNRQRLSLPGVKGFTLHPSSCCFELLHIHTIRMVKSDDVECSLGQELEGENPVV
ncbi:hypothetical protein VIGAN_01029300 [Vigna angularis var. angularis]|uniref:Uncharacterized protein n=1 Tax=Vigna angularis var. angularis TaxID=157739 RepID=A0A0S3QX03_PHAAN|nr:hypothetical protein VIGAN_01029300 [Vigna angularis var. angularis]